MHDTVREAMITVPNTHAPTLTVGEARGALANPKVHLLLLTEDGVLLGTVAREDLTGPDDAPALTVARLAGRTIAPDAAVLPTRDAMAARGQRRLAVVDAEHRLLGLLCLKAHQGGFCTDAGVLARRAER